MPKMLLPKRNGLYFENRRDKSTDAMQKVCWSKGIGFKGTVRMVSRNTPKRLHPSTND